LYIERHKGYGFVEYEDYEDCLHAIENMNDAELCGKVLRVNFAKPQRFKEGYHKAIWTEEDYYKNKQPKVEENAEKDKKFLE
jgi:peptidyl-prolyl isomerase E (cyclophilin E)